MLFPSFQYWMYCKAYMESSKIVPLGESCQVCRRSAVLWKWINEKKTQGQYVACTVQKNLFFSWDIWLHQLEFLYCCSDKWFYSQFTSFCFSVLLDCSLCFLFTPCQFGNFCLLFLYYYYIVINFPRLILCLYMQQHTQAQSLTKFITVRNNS